MPFFSVLALLLSAVLAVASASGDDILIDVEDSDEPIDIPDLFWHSALEGEICPQLEANAPSAVVVVDDTPVEQPFPAWFLKRSADPLLPLDPDHDPLFIDLMTLDVPRTTPDVNNPDQGRSASLFNGECNVKGQSCLNPSVEDIPRTSPDVNDLDQGRSASLLNGGCNVKAQSCRYPAVAAGVVDVGSDNEAPDSDDNSESLGLRLARTILAWIPPQYENTDPWVWALQKAVVWERTAVAGLRCPQPWSYRHPMKYVAALYWRNLAHDDRPELGPLKQSLTHAMNCFWSHSLGDLDAFAGKHQLQQFPFWSFHLRHCPRIDRCRVEKRPAPATPSCETRMTAVTMLIKRQPKRMRSDPAQVAVASAPGPSRRPLEAAVCCGVSTG